MHYLVYMYKYLKQISEQHKSNFNFWLQFSWIKFWVVENEAILVWILRLHTIFFLKNNDGCKKSRSEDMKQDYQREQKRKSLVISWFYSDS